MTHNERKEITKKAHDSVYSDVINELIWHRDYHNKKMLEYLNTDDTLFKYNFEKYQAYSKLVDVLKHFKF